jgi:hypothetical protein
MLIFYAFSKKENSMIRYIPKKTVNIATAFTLTPIFLIISALFFNLFEENKMVLLMISFLSIMIAYSALSINLLKMNTSYGN